MGKVIEYDRVPPHSLQAEQAVLGAMMLDPTAIDEVVQLLRPEAFYLEKHQIIYSAALELHDAQKPVDIIHLPDQLRKLGALDSVGGTHYLSELGLRTPTAATVMTHARVVYEKSMLRRAIAAGREVWEACYTPGADAFAEIDKAQQKLFNVAIDRPGKTYQTLTSVVKSLLPKIRERMGTHNGIIGLSTGLHELDRITGGLHKGDLIILAARPAMGKSGLAATIASNVAIGNGAGVAYFSLEMSNEQNTTRLISIQSKVALSKMRNGRLSEQEYQQIEAAADFIENGPIYLDDTPGLTVMQLRSRARLLHRQHGIEMIVVDYLQLMKGSDPRAGIRETIVEITRGLKELAKELEVPIIALSQLNRSLESRPDKRPMLSDLKESGSIEEDADIVLFLYRDEYYGVEFDFDTGKSTTGLAEIIVAKQRNGATGTVNAFFDAERAAFKDLTTLHEAPQRYAPLPDGEEAF